MLLVRSFIILVFFATNGAAQTLQLDLLQQQQSQGLPLGSDMQSLENKLSRQGFDVNPENDNPENDARTAKEPVIPNEQNVKVLDRRLAAEEAQQRLQDGQALSNDLMGGQSKLQALSMVETYYKVLTGENLDVFGTGKSAASNNIANDPAEELVFFNSLGSDYRLAAGDVLAISIRGLSIIDEETVVDGEGKIAISGMLPVIAVGRSIADVQNDIKKILEVDDASVSVYVSLAAARLVSVQITGAVGTPGIVAVPAYTPVSRILPLVGDILPQGSARNILLFQNGDRQTVDLYQSLLGIDDADDPLVVNNARLHVGDQGATAAVAGFVGRPGVFEMAAGQTEISIDELFQFANIRLIAPGTKMDLLRFNDQGVPISESIDFGEDQMVQAGQALQIRFVQTRTQTDVKVFGAVEESFSLNVVNPMPIAELLRNGAALKPDAYMDFAIIAGKRSESSADRTINLNKALQFPDRFLIQPGETLIILDLNQYQTLLKQSLTKPGGRITQLLISAEPAEVFIDGSRVAFVAVSETQEIMDIFGSQLPFPQDIAYDFALLLDPKAGEEKPKAFSLSNFSTANSSYSLTNAERLQLFTKAFLREVKLPNLGDYSPVQTFQDENQPQAALALVEVGPELDVSVETSRAARNIAASGPAVAFVDGKPYSYLPADIKFSSSQAALELMRSGDLYPLYVDISTRSADGYSFSGQTYELGDLVDSEATFVTKGNMRLDFYTNSYVQQFILKNEQLNLKERQNSDFISLRASSRFVYGAVRRPGRYPVAGDLTLDLLLRVTGGPLPIADLKNVILRTYVARTDGTIELQGSKVIDLTSVDPASITLSGNYDIQIPALINNALSGVVSLDGEVQRPGQYTVGRDETLHDVIERAGGFTEVAYPLGAVMIRDSLKAEQTRANLTLARQVEQSILSLSQNASAEQDQQVPAVLALASQLRNLKGSGRQIVNATLKSGENPVFLENGDSLFIPKRPSHVSVIGSVYNEVSAVYAPFKTPRDYISEAGGTSKIADSKNIYMVLPNGQSEPIGETDSANVIIPPGAVLIVPPKVDKLTPLGLSRVVSDILSNIATSLLAINAVR
jgi:protein involved in polysaccharide export with SLBB domain